MTGEQFREMVAENAKLAEGVTVRVHWGYGLGFRVSGVGVVTKVFRKSVRVRLLADVAAPCGEPWRVGHELQGIPRFGNPDWRHGENGVEVLEAISV